MMILKKSAVYAMLVLRGHKGISFLIHTRYRAKFGQRTPCIPSRFLSEIPEDFIEEIDKTDIIPTQISCRPDMQREAEKIQNPAIITI
jgi:hypothetical protein